MPKVFCRAALFVCLISAATALGEEATKTSEPTTEPPKQEKTLWDKTKDFGGKALEKGEAAVDSLKKSNNDNPLRRAERDFNLSGSYSYFDFWTLGKWGFSSSWQSADHSWDLQYQHGSFGYGISIADLGQLSEDRLQALKRSYGSRNTFNWYYGLFYNKFNVEFGDRILSLITSGAYPNVDVLTIETVGFTVGLGNRWQWKNGFTIGADWFELNMPVFTLRKEADILKSDAPEDDKDTVRKAMDVIRYFPAIAIIKVSLGYSF